MIISCYETTQRMGRRSAEGEQDDDHSILHLHCVRRSSGNGYSPHPYHWADEVFFVDKDFEMNSDKSIDGHKTRGAKQVEVRNAGNGNRCYD